MAEAELTNLRVTYRLGATIPLGENTFANIKPEFEISADIPDGTSPTAAKERLERTLDAWLEKKFEEVGKKLVVKA
jgi:hypothetical protein